MSLVIGRRAIAAVPRRTIVSRKEFSTLLTAEQEFPGLPTLSPESATATAASVTTLSNGVTIVSEGSSSTSTVSLTFPKAGSANEALGEQGGALINKCLNFRSGSSLSTLLINRTIENEGGTPYSMVGRDCASLGYTVAPDKATGLIPLLATDCAFEKWDVRDAKRLAEVETEEAVKSAQIVLTEQLYAAAYGPQSPGGRSLYASDLGMDGIKSFRSRAYGLNGAVLAATGISDHSAFCTEAEELLSDSVVGTDEPPAKMTYLGGESRLAAPSAGYAHVALAFEAPESSVVANVIKKLFNVAGAEAGVSSFGATGLVGVYAGSPSPSGLVDLLITTLTTTVTSDSIKRAKGLAKAEALFALDGGSQALAQVMTASVLETGSFSGPADVAAAYDAVTDKDVNNALTAMSKCNPALAAVGDISTVPYHATVAARFSK